MKSQATTPTADFVEGVIRASLNATVNMQSVPSALFHCEIKEISNAIAARKWPHASAWLDFAEREILRRIR